MYPEDRVLVGVVNSLRDLKFARDDHWYRIPQQQLPNGVYAEYIALFLSGPVFKERSGGVHYFAAKRGVELAYRRDLLPQQPRHRRAHEVYYKVQLDALRDKQPPVLNPTRRRFAFVYTTWDRFVQAQTVADLYSAHDYYVDRLYHALRSRHVALTRTWDAQRRETGSAPQLRILCQNGTVIASVNQHEGQIFLDSGQPDDMILARILAAVTQQGGPALLNIPLEGEP
ncbi:MAG: hypothetical protein HXY40_07695 [Chloroflexi bacterium]|nr:hypothetical protein [Chloroflexota bacterium]